MATFVLVHGAWSGAHGFRHVRRNLQAAGHEVFTPSLTGIGERVHLTSPQVGLTTHVRDLVNHLAFEDLDGIVVVGFSYGGCVVTGSLQHIAERVRHLVYLDAFVPRDGESLASLAGWPVIGAAGIADDWLVPPVPRIYDDDAEAEFMAARPSPSTRRPRTRGKSPAWHYREIACNHMVASNRPRELTDILVACAAAPSN